MKQIKNLYFKYLKRVLDVVISLLLVIVLLPFIVIIMLINTLIYWGNPFFLQKRIGYNNKAFILIKFKTMYDIVDEKSKGIHDISRLSKFGRIIRGFSLDEIPQFFNVISGKMSLVGPRPLLQEYLPLYSDIHIKRHEVKPGITGWAQIRGRNAIKWIQKFDYDIWYVNNLSFKIDMKILYLTIVKVIIKKDINKDLDTTMEPFNGGN